MIALPRTASTVLLVMTVWTSSGLAQAGSAVPSVAPKPKYGPEATTLSHEHEFFRANPAPDFWALIPYYVPQRNGASCSLASVTMVMNGARTGRSLGSEDPLVTQDGLLKKTGNGEWARAVGSFAPTGVTLDQLGGYVRGALQAYGFSKAQVDVVHADSLAPEAVSALEKVLAENEKSSDDFIIINFNQQTYTGDAEVGHIAPIAAYDGARHRVLVLDPDREWYEPYWVSVKTLLAGMATRDRVSGKNRGYVRIKLNAR